MNSPATLRILIAALVAAVPYVAHAQASVDSSARAVAADERGLNGRVVARKTVAVLPFDVHSVDTTLAPLGHGLAALISDDLARSHRLTMVERLRLTDIQSEQRLQQTAAVDQSTAVDGSKLIAAQHLVFGTIDASSGKLSIDERVVAVTSGQMEMRPQSNGSLDAIFRAERNLVMATFDGFGVKLTPDELRSLDERVPPKLGAFLAFSRGARAESFGNDEEAVAAFQEAASLDKSFSLAQNKLAAARQRVVAHTSPTASRAAPEKEDAKEALAEKDAKPAAPVSGSAPGGSLAPPSASSTAAKTKSSTKKAPTHTKPASSNR